MKCLKKLLSILAVSFFCLESFAYSPFKIDLNIEFGALKGEINEYVIYAPMPDTEYIESRLDWDLDFIIFAGVSADIVLFEHLYFGLAGRIGFPGSSGYMQDYDWLNVEKYPECNWLTNYSKHENVLAKYFDGSVKIGGIINLPFKFFFMPSVSFQGQEFAFDGWNGYCQYSSARYANGALEEWNDEIPKTSLSSKVISYNQQRFFLFMGLRVYTTIVPGFCFAVEGNYSPLAVIGAVDNHWIRNTVFWDQPMGSGTWNVAGRVQFSFNKSCRLALTCDYQCVPILTGDSYSKSNGNNAWRYETGYLGGASSSLFSFSIMATLFF